jgi:hypothetical protein
MQWQKYSALALAWNGLTGNWDWPVCWRDAAPRDRYDVLIIGGHGLATAYYLAKNHDITNAAVIENGWIGSGMLDATPRSSAPII